MVFSAIKSHSPIVGQPANPRKLTFAFFFRFFNSFRNFLVFLVWTQWEVGSSTLIFPSALENVGPTGYIHKKLLFKKEELHETVSSSDRTSLFNNIFHKHNSLNQMARLNNYGKICFTVKSPPQLLQKLHSVLLFIFVKERCDYSGTVQ